MKADHYHQMRVALDRALALFSESSGSLSTDDYQLKHDLEVLRSRLLKAESTTPFPVKGPATITPGAVGDPDLTEAPWYGSRGNTSP